MDWHFVGVDLGQAKDFTAIAAVERAEVTGAWDAQTYARRKSVSLRLRYLERLALGTPYPEVVERVVGLTRSSELAGHCHLVVDATGVGRPVVDLLRRAGPGCQMMPATITGGDAESREGGYYRVPKRDVIVGLQVLLQSGELKIAGRLRYGAALVSEMAEMRVKVSGAGREQYGAWREGTHDDLVFAVGLACWGVRKIYPGPLRGDQRWCRASAEQRGRIV
jgi:CubicO group peptidase (beta-lactamase class C family)